MPVVLDLSVEIPASRTPLPPLPGPAGLRLGRLDEGKQRGKQQDLRPICESHRIISEGLIGKSKGMNNVAYLNSVAAFCSVIQMP